VPRDRATSAVRGELRSLSQREIADFCPKAHRRTEQADKPF
jgi:hypothetical protein